LKGRGTRGQRGPAQMLANKQTGGGGGGGGLALGEESAVTQYVQKLNVDFLCSFRAWV